LSVAALSRRLARPPLFAPLSRYLSSINFIPDIEINALCGISAKQMWFCTVERQRKKSAHPATTERRSTMQAKHKLSAAALIALLSAVGPAITHAESQQEWFLRQLQMTDGDTPATPTAPPKKSDGNASRTDTQAAKGSEGGTGYVGTSTEGSVGSAIVVDPKNYYNGFSPYSSDPQYSAP
jgi:hypothetical protein